MVRKNTDSFDDLYDWVFKPPHKFEKIALAIIGLFTFPSGFAVLAFLFVWFLADRDRINKDIWGNVVVKDDIHGNPRDKKKT